MWSIISLYVLLMIHKTMFRWYRETNLPRCKWKVDPCFSSLDPNEYTEGLNNVKKSLEVWTIWRATYAQRQSILTQNRENYALNEKCEWLRTYVTYDILLDFRWCLKTHQEMYHFINPFHAKNVYFYPFNEEFVYTFNIYKASIFPYTRVCF